MSLNYNYNYNLQIPNLTTGNLVSTNVTVNNIYYTGNLIQNGTVSSILGSSNNYIATNLTTGTLNAGNLTTGNINFTGTLSQNGTPYLGSQWTTTAGNLSYTSGNVVVNNLTTGNLNFTGTLSQNGAPYVGSQWTSTAGNISYTSGNVVVTNFVNSNASIGSLSAGNISISGNMTVGGNLLVSGSLISVNVTSVNVIDNNISAGTLNAVISSIGNLNSTNISTGTLYSNTISTTSISTINDTVTNLNSTNITATNILTSLITSTNLLATNNTLTNTIFNNFTVSNLLANNLNLGISSFFSSSFLAANNISTASPINGLVFNNTNINYFEIKLSISIVASVNLTQTYNLYGSYNASGWSLFTNFIGDTTGVVFSITAGGQVVYTSTNVTGFVSDTFRYTVQQFTSSGTYTSLAASTQGNYIFNTVQVTSTTDSVIGTSVGAIQVLGGATITKQVNIQATSGASGIGSGGSLTVFGGTAISGNMIVGGGISSSLNTNTIGNIFTTGGNVGIGNANPGFTLDVSGTARFTSSITTGSIFSTNITSTNIFGTNITTSGLISNLITVNSLLATTNISTSNVFSTNITTVNLVSSFTSIGNLTSLTGTFANNVGGSQTVGTILITTSASLIGNTNTIGNLFTTGGNVGINTTSPGFTLDVSGTARFTGSITTGSIFSTNTTTTNLVSTTSTIPNLNTTNITTISLISTSVSSSSLNSTNTTTTNLVSTTSTIPNLNTTNLISNLITVNSLLATSNITTSNVFSTNITSTNLVSSFTSLGNLTSLTGTFANKVGGSQTVGTILVTTSASLIGNTNTIGNIFTTGGNVGIGIVSPSTNLHVNTSIFIDSTNNTGLLKIVSGNNTNYIESGLQYITNSTADLRFTNMNASATFMIIATTGNVGINTTSPQFTLDVNGSLRAVALNTAPFSPPHTLINTGTLQPSVVSLFAPNVTVGNYVSTMFGQSLSNGNCGQLSFGYNGSNNSANNMSLSMYGGGAASYISLNNNGNMGINTTTPLYPLHVVGSSTNTVTGGYYFATNTSSLQPFSTSPQPISIFANLAILTQSNFLASSDLRIKNVCDEEINLNLIDCINPVIYTYKDKIKNPKKNIGFIAQNVFEHCPEAVTLHKGIIPDIMKLVDIIENKDTIITIKNEWLLKEKDIIKIMVDDKDTAGELIDIIYADKDVIKFKHQKLKENVFIYGRQVGDFHELNYDYVFALGFAGIQKSRKEIKELKQDNILLTKGIKELKQQINHQQQQINSLVELIKNKK